MPRRFLCVDPRRDVTSTKHDAAECRVVLAVSSNGLDPLPGPIRVPDTKLTRYLKRTIGKDALERINHPVAIVGMDVIEAVTPPRGTRPIAQHPVRVPGRIDDGPIRIEDRYRLEQIPEQRLRTLRVALVTPSTARRGHLARDSMALSSRATEPTLTRRAHGTRMAQPKGRTCT